MDDLISIMEALDEYEDDLTAVRQRAPGDEAAYDRLDIIAAAARAHLECLKECDHDWVDARNQYVSSGEWCPKCNAIRAGNVEDSDG